MQQHHGREYRCTRCSPSRRLHEHVPKLHYYPLSFATVFTHAFSVFLRGTPLTCICHVREQLGRGGFLSTMWGPEIKPWSLSLVHKDLSLLSHLTSFKSTRSLSWACPSGFEHSTAHTALWIGDLPASLPSSRCYRILPPGVLIAPASQHSKQEQRMLFWSKQ